MSENETLVSDIPSSQPFYTVTGKASTRENRRSVISKPFAKERELARRDGNSSEPFMARKADSPFQGRLANRQGRQNGGLSHHRKRCADKSFSEELVESTAGANCPRIASQFAAKLPSQAGCCPPRMRDSPRHFSKAAKVANADASIRRAPSGALPTSFKMVMKLRHIAPVSLP